MLAPPELPASLPELLGGALLFGPSSRACRQRLASISTRGQWRAASALQHVVGPGDPRFPEQDCDTIDLQISTDELARRLKEPFAAWWPLCAAPRQPAQRIVIRLLLPPDAAIVKGISRLSQAFPHTQFLIDPFRHGTAAAWQAHVRLAEYENVWLTTMGLYGQGDARESLYFIVGEAGAGKLVFASGWRWEELPGVPSPERWLKRMDFLDAPQRELILWRNAQTLFGVA